MVASPVIWVGPPAHLLVIHPFGCRVEPSVKAVDACWHWEWCSGATARAKGTWCREPTDQKRDETKHSVVVPISVEGRVRVDDVSNWTLEATTTNAENSAGKEEFSISGTWVASRVFAAERVINWEGRDDRRHTGHVLATPIERPCAREAKQATADKTGISTSNITTDGEVGIIVLDFEIPFATRRVERRNLQVSEIAHKAWAAGPAKSVVTAPGWNDCANVGELGSFGSRMRNLPGAVPVAGAENARMVVPQRLLSIRVVSIRATAANESFARILA